MEEWRLLSLEREGEAGSDRKQMREIVIYTENHMSVTSHDSLFKPHQEEFITKTWININSAGLCVWEEPWIEAGKKAMNNDVKELGILYDLIISDI